LCGKLAFREMMKAELWRFVRRQLANNIQESTNNEFKVAPTLGMRTCVRVFEPSTGCYCSRFGDIPVQLRGKQRVQGCQPPVLHRNSAIAQRACGL